MVVADIFETFGTRVLRYALVIVIINVTSSKYGN